MFESNKRLRNEDGSINYEGEFDRILSVLINNAEIPSSYINIDLNTEERKIADDLNVKPTDILNGLKLYLYSNRVGTGKTTLATYFLQKFITWYCKYRGSNSIDCVGYFVNCRDYISLKKASFSNRELIELVNNMEDRMRIAPLVVFDEAYLPNISEYDIMLIYSIMNYRDSYNKASIYTSNYDPKQLMDNMGASIARRILQGAKAVEVNNEEN